MLSKSRAVSVLLMAVFIALISCSISAPTTNAAGFIKFRSKHMNSVSSNIGMIMLDGKPFPLPIDLNVGNVQEHPISFILSVAGCEFVMWEVEGGVTVRDPRAQTTMLTAGGDGTLTAVYKGICGPVGGAVLPTNTYITLAPYLALIGLIVTAAVAVKKRRN